MQKLFIRYWVWFSIFFVVVIAVVAVLFVRFRSRISQNISLVSNKFPLVEEQGNTFSLHCLYQSGKEISLPISPELSTQYLVKCIYQNGLDEADYVDIVFAAYNEKLDQTYIYGQWPYSGSFSQGAFSGFDSNYAGKEIVATFPSKIVNEKERQVSDIFQNSLQTIFSMNNLQEFAKSGESKYLKTIDGQKILVVLNMQ